MPAEQDVDIDVHAMAVNHRHNDWALGTLARAYLRLEAELLAAQEREKALASYRDDLLHQAREDYRKLNQAAEREKALREALEAAESWLTKDANGSGPFPVSALNEIQRALAGSPSEKTATPVFGAEKPDNEEE